MNGKTHILVVEDDPRDRELIEREFAKRDDCDPWFVYTAQEALECIRHRNPQLVLLDLNMPAMTENGIWVLAEMRRHKLITPVAIMSGQSTGPVVDAALLEYPVLLVVTKPLDQDKINQVLQAFWP